MKWIGQHIYDLVARFRNDVYLEDLSTTTETNVLVVDSTGKVSKTTVITGDVTGVTAGSNITVTDPTGPVPTVALSTNVDVAGTLDVTSLGTFDASVTVAGDVGIGTTSPQSKLHIETGSGGTYNPNVNHDDVTIEGSGSIGLQLFSPATTYQYIAFGDPDSVNAGYIRYYHGTNQMVFRTNGDNNMIINSEGNVGIGTTSPAQKLDVVGKISLKDAGDSIFVGYQAGLNDDASANQNVGVGYQALRANTTGSNNTASGYQSLRLNTTGGTNTAAGRDSLYSNTTGSSNTALGYAALLVNTTGSYNSAFGTTALRSNTTGSSSVAVGREALYNNTASNQTAVGYQALYSNTTGASNSAVGYQALRSNTTGASNTAIGLNALYSNTTASSNTATGLEALRQNTTGANNTATGRSALYYNTTGSQSVAVGMGALQTNTTGANNSAHGYRALYSNTTGSYNSATGTNALWFNTTGANNTATGLNALYSNTTGASNTAIGRDAGRFIADGTTANTVTSNSVFLGYNTKALADSQTNQIVIGDSAVGLGSNTAILGNSSITKTQLQGNVGIGTASPDALLEISGNAGADPGPITNPTTFRITDAGNAATGAGDVTNPWGKIEFYSEDVSSTGPSVQAQIASVYNTVYSDSSDLNFYTRASPAVPLSTRMTIEGGGNVGIGTTSPASKLHIQTDTTGTEVPLNIYGYRTAATAANARLVSVTQLNTYGIGVLDIYNSAQVSAIHLAADGDSYINPQNSGNVGIGTTSPKNKLDIVGSLGRGAPVTKTTDFTVAATENWLIMNGTATITITLPTASSFTGRELMIKNIAAYTVISASSNVKPIDTDNAATAILPATAGSWCALVSDGTNWVTMMN
jgi:hypothetical protein